MKDWRSRGTVRRAWRSGPPWWPENEPWPPARARWHGRRGFVRRVGCLFAAPIALIIIGGATLASWLARQFGLDAGAPTFAALAAAASFGLLAFAALTGLMMRRVGFPLGDIVTAADRVATGDYAVRVGEHGPPWLRSVARAFNAMTSRLEIQDGQRRELMSDIAHELRTPLAVIQGRLEGLIDGVYERDDARLESLLEDTRVLARLVEDLRLLAHSESGMLPIRREPTEMPALVSDAASGFEDETAARGISMRIEGGEDLPAADVDPLRIRQVLVNLLSNAVRHTPDGGAIDVTVVAVGRALVVRVHDNGPGIPADELPRIFDRFQRGAGSSGSGLGLTIARNLVLAHGGRIDAASDPRRGTTVWFTVPVYRD